MKLDGKFTYRRENQRTLSFNVDIRKLPKHKTVFAGSSSKKLYKWSLVIKFVPLLLFRQLQCLWFWDQTEQVPGPLHPLHLLALRHVCHDVLGILLCSSSKRIHNDNKVIYLFNLFIFFSHSFNAAKFNLIPYCICCSYSHFVNFKKFLTNLHSKNSILKTQ